MNDNELDGYTEEEYAMKQAEFEKEVEQSHIDGWKTGFAVLLKMRMEKVAKNVCHDQLTTHIIIPDCARETMPLKKQQEIMIECERYIAFFLKKVSEIDDFDYFTDRKNFDYSII